MRFMIMHKMNEQLEKGGPHEPQVLAAVGQLVEQAVKDGVFVAGEGLKPTAERTHVVYRGGKRTVADGPFMETKELVGGFGVLCVASKEEAIHWCDRFAAILGDVELYMGPLVEPWDFGVAAKPANAPLRYLSAHRMDDRAEADLPPDPALFPKMGALIEEMTKAGVLQAGGGLASTKHGARVHFRDGKSVITDGPFAESKELIAGFAILELPSKAAALDWAVRFGEIVKVDEVEVRLIPEG